MDTTIKTVNLPNLHDRLKSVLKKRKISLENFAKYNLNIRFILFMNYKDFEIKNNNIKHIF
jgi:hypothetical protein